MIRATMGNTHDVNGELEPAVVSFTRRALEFEENFQCANIWTNLKVDKKNRLLSLGVLGYTWEELSVQPLIVEFVERFSYDRLIELMPNYGNDLFITSKLCLQLHTAKNLPWPQYPSQFDRTWVFELQKFMLTGEMIQLQVERAALQYGITAYTQMVLAKTAYEAPREPKFNEFLFWFNWFRLETDDMYGIGDEDLVDITVIKNHAKGWFAALFYPDFLKTVDLILREPYPPQFHKNLLHLAYLKTAGVYGSKKAKDFQKLCICLFGVGYFNGKSYSLSVQTGRL